MVALSLLSLLLAPAALAAPWRRGGGFKGPCSVPQSTFSLPSNFDKLSTTPNLVLVGIGVQNYTCNSNRTFTNVGALAQLFDISCLSSTPEFNTIQNDAFNIWESCPDTNPFGPTTAQAMQSAFNISVDSQHYFVQNSSGSNLEAVWDSRTSGQFSGDPNAIVFAHKVETSPSPDGPRNIDLVELKKDSGGLANTVYRLNTVEGQAPGNCSPGDSTSVKYAAKYLLL